MTAFYVQRPVKRRRFKFTFSQRGLLRQRKNPNQREFDGTVPLERNALEAINDRLVEQHKVWLHPTKGYRTVSINRTRAALSAAEMAAGRGGLRIRVRKPAKAYTPNGTREVARRIRQAEARANG